MPPVTMRLIGSPVSGCFVKAASLMLCLSSYRFGVVPFLAGIVS
jgi:hypothetical protein